MSLLCLKFRWALCVLFLTNFLNTAQGNVVNGELKRYVKNSFAPRDAVMNHLTIHNNNVYVGARNRLYQLDRSLQLLHNVTTGPVMDNVNCKPHEDMCSLKMLTNNTNKLLLVDVQNNRLIVCGSVYQGTCKTRSLEDINQVLYDISQNQPLGVVDADFVACNEEACSTVGVITEGPTVNNNVLYVSTTLTSHLLRHDYSISTHSLAHDLTKENNLFRLTIDKTSDDGSVFKKPKDHSTRDYKYTFATGNEDGFVYFVFNHSLQNDVSKAMVARICKSDPFYDSYIEMPLECAQVNANHLLAANYIPDSSKVNSDGTLYLLFSKDNQVNSALCGIKKSELDYLFYNTMEVCYKSSGYNGSNQTANLIKSNLDNGCVNDQGQKWLKDKDNLTDEVIVVSDISLNYYLDYKVPKKSILCGAFYLPSQIRRLVVTQVKLLFQKSGFTFSAITTNQTGTNNKTTVAFIGTTSGLVIQVNLNTGQEYSSIPVGDPILTDFVWDTTPNLAVPHLYVQTKQKVLRIQVAACEKFATCDLCVTSRDPYCGWCILENRCSTKEQCTTANFDQTRWIAPDSTKCIRASPPEPRERAVNGEITTKVYLLPVLEGGESYECLFDDEFAVGGSVQKRSSYTEVRCQAPTEEDLLASAYGQDYVNVSLSLRYRKNNISVSIVSTTAIFYDCHAHGKNLQINTPCSGCLSSKWGCNWCTGDHMCKAREEQQDSCITNPMQCPTFTEVSPADRLIPVGQPHTITLAGKNLPTQLTTYWCHVTIGQDEPIKVEAQRNGNNVTCESRKYNYTKYAVTATASIRVTWKLKFVVDFQQSTPLTFYKCSVTRSDCSLCVASDSMYKCGWCDNKQACTIESSCPASQSWITDASLCPVHAIQGFSPMSGPLLGGTKLTITGINMGTQPQDIQQVTVAGQPCKILNQYYQTSLKVVCQTAKSSKRSGKISVTIRNETKESKEDFVYRDPIPSQLFPILGPQAGGTLINITGDFLNTGSDITVSIGDSLSCDIQETNYSYLTCVTQEAPRPIANMTVTLTFDQLSLSLKQRFTYTANPQIHKVYSLSEGPSLGSFLGGGRNISFEGNNLTSVQTPIFFVETGYPDITNHQQRRKREVFDKHHFLRSVMRKRSIETVNIDKALSAFTSYKYSSICTVVNATFMYCPSPTITSLVMNVSSNITQYVKLPAKLSLSMDKYKADLKTFGNLTYLPNPRVEQLTDQDKLYKENDFLVLRIYDLNQQAITKDEIIVMVGSSRCLLKAFITEEPLCKVPKKEGDASSYPVELTIGNLRHNIGTIKYATDDSGTGITTYVLAIVIPVTVGLIVLIIAIVCVCMKKSYKSNKNDFQKAMESMEMSVRADFRKAFAELSIDMDDLAGDVGDYGIPCLDYRTYITNLFFPSHRYHPCMHEPTEDSEIPPDLEHGLAQFLLLLSNHNFLSVFVHTLEDQKNFGTRDKGNVASLLSVVLHEKLDYFTEIMKSLVSDLISNNVMRNPKLVMRRSDSVAERMLSNWMYICLYPYLRDSAGGPLFLLLKAIKQQVSKGPLDAITGKARYTLSDDRLLKEDIEFDILTLFIETNDEEPVIVKVLSCDSVAQVKEKVMDAVYKRVPFSQRPRTDQLDIEWRTGRNGHLVLPTQDFTVEPGSRWRRLMSISDYKVANNATLALIRKQQEYEDSQDMSSMLSNHSMETSPLSPMLPEEASTKMYHLVKYNDDNETKRESTIPKDKHKHIPELYLLRLVNMKGILQNYVDKVMQAILDKNIVPCPVRHFFHFLDEIASKNGITDPEILHIWKTNSFLSRFWVTLLKNPEAVFDVEKPDTIASSMAVISQTFIDACSVNEHKPTKDSPINKQIYAKEIPNYKKMVQEYYKVVKEQHPISDQEVNTYIAEISRSHACKFDKNRALRDLWCFMSKYYEEIKEALENDPNVTPAVIQKLEQSNRLIENNSTNND
uniref:Plexin-B1 n=1 Tax=Phallusia mammillata TaxID=59560 RepID=A0A6F9DP43_9ASCI|nr:plexin-B1 [Phallusia mammillata]